MIAIRCMAAVVLLLAGGGGALSAEAGGEAEAPDPLRFGTKNRYLEFAPFAQMEAGHLNASPNGFMDGLEDVDGQMRRARLYTTFGYDRISGEFTFDLVTDPYPTIIYAYLDYALTDALTLEVGQQNGIFSLQDATSSRPALFNEDGQNATLQPEDYVGASLRYGASDFSLSGGVFGSDANLEPFGEGWTAMGRATLAPVNRDDAVLHVGLGLVHREDIEDPLSFSGDVGLNLFDVTTITTGDYERVRSYDAANPEAAAILGRFTLAGEYTLGHVRDAERANATLQGGYASLLVFLTDDRRAYDGSTGTFERVKPKAPVSPGGEGFGAIEIGGRFDWLDLTDAGPEAGAEIAATGIVNWYLHEKVRVSASHTYTHVTEGPDAGADFHASLARLWFVY